MDLLTGNTGGDDNNVSTSQSELQSIILGEVTSDFLVHIFFFLVGLFAMLREYTYGDRGDVREICSHTGGVDNIIEGKVINKRARLQQKGERLNDVLVELIIRDSMSWVFVGCCSYLANATSSSKNN